MAWENAVPLGIAAVCIWIGVYRHQIGSALGLMDMPDGGRKAHPRPTAIVGGLMFLVCAVALVVTAYATGPHGQRLYIVGSIVIAHGVLGLTDDKYSVPAAARLIYSFSLTAAVLMTDRALVVRDIYFSFGLSFGLNAEIEYFLTVLFIVGFVYAVNMIDGLNGLLATYGLIVTAFVWQWLYGGNEIYLLSVLAVLVIFLVLNLGGRVFAGDGGSYIVGAAAAVMLLDLYDRLGPARAFPLDLMGVVIFVPVADAVRVSIGRLSRGASAFVSDRNHLHHLLCDRFGPIGALVAWSSLVAVPVIIAVRQPQLAYIALAIEAAAYGFVVWQSRPSTRVSGNR
jgi:UDP-GlcNAc:undecaprenyl-phosphate GlcNAc-1-phosphate transferase